MRTGDIKQKMDKFESKKKWIKGKKIDRKKYIPEKERERKLCKGCQYNVD